VVNLDTITTIARTSLEAPVAALSPARIRAVDTAIHFALGLEE
jgi:mRNA-degrading endonuclease toxin of MazEF toxin-antitoxin module